MTKPLLIYVYKGGHTWYHRGIPWKQATDVTQPPTDPSVKLELKDAPPKYNRHINFIIKLTCGRP